MVSTNIFFLDGRLAECVFKDDGAGDLDLKELEIRNCPPEIFILPPNIRGNGRCPIVIMVTLLSRDSSMGTHGIIRGEGAKGQTC